MRRQTSNKVMGDFFIACKVNENYVTSQMFSKHGRKISSIQIFEYSKFQNYSKFQVGSYSKFQVFKNKEVLGVVKNWQVSQDHHIRGFLQKLRVYVNYKQGNNISKRERERKLCSILLIISVNFSP